jgi:Protein of unknown function (DUF2523)
MPVFLAALIGGLVSACGTLVGRVLVSLGFSYVAFTGVNASIDWVRAEFLAGVSGLPGAAIGIMGLLKVGTCVSMLLSAVATRLLLAGLTSGTLKRMVLK